MVIGKVEPTKDPSTITIFKSLGKSKTIYQVSSIEFTTSFLTDVG